MANQKISDLTQTTSLSDSDLIPIAHKKDANSYETLSTTLSDLKNNIVGSAGAISKIVYSDGNEAIYTSGDTLYLYDDSSNKVAYLNPLSNPNPNAEPDSSFQPNSKLAIGTSSVVEGIIKFSNRNKVAATTTTQAKVLATKFNLSDIGFRLSREEYTGSTNTGAWQLRMNSLDSYLYSKNHVEITAGSKTIDSKLSLSDLLTSAEADTEVRINLLSGGDIFNTARDAVYFTTPVFQVKNGNEDTVFTITATDTILQDASQGNILSQHYDSTNTANNTIKLSRGEANDLLTQDATTTTLNSSGGNMFIQYVSDDTKGSEVNICRDGEPFLHQNPSGTTIHGSDGTVLLGVEYINNSSANTRLSLARGNYDYILNVLTQDKNDMILFDSNNTAFLTTHYDGSNTANNTLTLSRGGENNVLTQDKTTTNLISSDGDTILNYNRSTNGTTQIDTLNLYLEGNDIITASCKTTDSNESGISISRAGHNEILTQDKSYTYLNDSDGTRILIAYFDSSDTANNTLEIDRGDGSLLLVQSKTNTTLYDSNSAALISHTVGAGVQYSADGVNYFKLYNNAITVSQPVTSTAAISAKGITNTALTAAGIVTNTAAGVLGTISVLPVVNGGTGSSTKNFVDLTTDQTAAGVKTFTSGIKTSTIKDASGNNLISVDTSSALTISRGSADNVLTQNSTTTALNNSSNSTILQYVIDTTNNAHDLRIESVGNAAFVAHNDLNDNINSFVCVSRFGIVDVLLQDGNNTTLSDSANNTVLSCSYDGSDPLNNGISLSRGSNNLLEQDKTSTTLYNSNSAALITHTVGAGVQYSADGANYFKLYNNAITVSQPVSSSSTIKATGLASTVQTLTDGASIVWNAATGSNAIITLTAAGRTLANPTNIVAGTVYRLTVNQDTTGSRTITTWGSYFKFPGGVKPTLTATASASDVLEFYADTITTLRLTNFIADSK
ncbi:MAG: hypothetical protein P4L28_11990 [Paludibacteraceae bacterium]|nr:hypothetical protein [Paludibacteraceae bacterium]